MHEDVLDLESRRTIYQTVKKFAGSHFREIQRRSGLAVGSVQYHLHFLARHDLIKEEKQGNNVVYYPREIGSDDAKLLRLLRQKSIRDVLISLLLHHAQSHEELARFVKLSPSTLSWHLKKLVQEKLIKGDKKGRKTMYRIIYDKDALIKLLITYQESFLDNLVDHVIEMWDFE